MDNENGDRGRTLVLQLAIPCLELADGDAPLVLQYLVGESDIRQSTPQYTGLKERRDVHAPEPPSAVPNGPAVAPPALALLQTL